MNKPTPLTRLERELLSALREARFQLEHSSPNTGREFLTVALNRSHALQLSATVIAKAEKQDADWDAYIRSSEAESDAHHYAHLDGMHKTPQPGCPGCHREENLRRQLEEQGENVGGKLDAFDAALPDRVGPFERYKGPTPTDLTEDPTVSSAWPYTADENDTLHGRTL